MCGPFPVSFKAFGVVNFVDAGKDLCIVGHAGQAIYPDTRKLCVHLGGEIEETSEDGWISLQPLGFQFGFVSLT